MEPITVLSLITVAGIILLLGLFVACIRYVYVAVSSQRTANEEWIGDESTSETDGTTVHSGTTDRTVVTRDTGDFVFGSNDDGSGSSDPRR